MNHDHHLQALLDKIRTEGVAKANAEAQALVAAAEAQAREIVNTAEQRAAAERVRAERDARAFEQRASEAVRQAARDVVLSVEKAIESHLEALLLSRTSSTLDPARLTSLVEAAVAAYLAGGEQELTVCLAATAAATAETLRAAFAQQAAASGVTLALDERTDTGFRIRLDKGRVEHDFTAAAITAAIARHLRPQLAALLKTTA